MIQSHFQLNKSARFIESRWKKNSILVDSKLGKSHCGVSTGVLETNHAYVLMYIILVHVLFYAQYIMFYYGEKVIQREDTIKISLQK